MASSFVPCHHNQFGTYPETKSPSSTSNVIEVTLIRQEFHHRGVDKIGTVYHASEWVDKTGTVYHASEPMESASINPYCEECEKSLLMHLTMDLPLSFYSAELVVHELKELLHRKHTELQEVNNKGLEPGCVWYDRGQYKLNYYFERDCDEDEEVDWVTPVGFGSERLVKVTVDGGWALYFA